MPSIPLRTFIRFSEPHFPRLRRGRIEGQPYEVAEKTKAKMARVPGTQKTLDERRPLWAVVVWAFMVLASLMTGI